MKFNKITLVALIAFSAFLFTACNDLAFDIDQTFTQSFDVNITEGNSGGDDIVLTEQMDISSGDLKENLDRIQELTIKSIKLRFTEYTGDEAARITGSIGFPQLTSVGYTIPELDVATLVKNEEDFIMFDQDGTSFPGDNQFPAQTFIDNLVDFLKTLPADQLNTTYSLNSSAYPVGFKVEMIIDIFAKVNAVK